MAGDGGLSHARVSGELDHPVLSEGEVLNEGKAYRVAKAAEEAGSGS